MPASSRDKAHRPATTFFKFILAGPHTEALVLRENFAVFSQSFLVLGIPCQINAPDSHFSFFRVLGFVLLNRFLQKRGKLF